MMDDTCLRAKPITPTDIDHYEFIEEVYSL